MSIYPSLTPGELAYRSTLLGPTDSTAGADAKLWLPIWSGEVLHAYDEYNMFEGRVTAQTIASGREKQFPITGTVGLKSAWAAGEYLYGGTDSKAGNFAVSLDNRPMAAYFELDNVDLMITQWEYRQELARQAGLTLANTRDKQIANYIAGAASVPLTAADPRSVSNSGNLSLPVPFDLSLAGTLTENTAEEALEVLKAIEEFNVECQENDVPMGTAFCAVPPKLFQAIRRLGVAESQPQASSMQPMFGGVSMAGGLGAGLKDGMSSIDDSLVYMGATIIKSNHVPTVDYGADTVGEDRYEITGLNAGVRGLIWMPDCVAALRKTGLVVDTEDDVRRNTTFTVASMLSGTGILKPELAKIMSSKAAAAADRATMLGALGTTAADLGYTNK